MDKLDKLDKLDGKTCPLAEATKALTWEQFAKMIGKNVYILYADEKPEYGEWYLVSDVGQEAEGGEEEGLSVRCMGPGNYSGFPERDYGDGYLAYRFPPYKFCDKEHCGLWDEQKQQCVIMTMANR